MAATDGYVCTLDERTVKKAQDELNENPTDRLAAVEALRQWVLSQPHLKCSTETRHLLAFLRAAKFSQLRAREKLEGLLTVVTQFPQWFTDIDTRHKHIQTLIDNGYAIPLPKKEPNGSPLLLYRIGKVDPSVKKIPVAEEIRAASIMAHVCNEDESVDIHGYVFIFDFTGYTAKHMARWSLDDMKKWTKCWQNNMPGRFKAFHYYNAGSFFEAMMTLTRPFLSKKFQDRIRLHNNLESLYKSVPMECLPDDYLPDDYEGPSAGPLDIIIKNFKQKATSDEIRNKILYSTNSKWGVDLSKKPNDGVPVASFRKLNVD